MDISLKVLNRYIKVDDQDPKELADKITSIGLEVEGMHNLANGNNMTIGHVLECVPHPDSDHLNVCKVEVKPGEIRQIVCGAPNVAANQKVIVANPGCDLGNGFIIKESKIRGVESNGMICSIAELGLDQRLLKPEDKEGIHILDDNAPVGEDPLEYIGLKDTILEIGLTPNRADCMALTSFAYEVGAILKRDVNLPKIETKGIDGSEINVKVDTDLCSFFGAKLVKGVTTKDSPEWLKNALLASGIKPINNIVDISNFVMLETGQPIHMYDYDKLNKKEFVIKTGFNRKEILLDGEEYTIEPNDIIVSTDDGIGCIAGVMGSNSTKIDENTTNIVIEVATFDGANLRETARRLNLLTDASQHYIKGALNTANSLNILERCANLLEELADAKEIYKSVTTDLNIEERYVEVSTSKVNGLLGTNISTLEIEEIFNSLKFEFTLNGEQFNVKVPTYRN
ncbi:MAG: phenylalanine--tRNA ligase subunit beta, partial [Thomasclavelia sp.]|nr:phenylalanine--tRNA ligase subunit beta [Thomasclavelia sp.]